MNTPTKFPLYAKLSLLLIGLYFSISMLSITQDILLPIIYAIIIATLISPAVNYLVKKRLNRVVSITLVLAFSFLIVAGVIAFVVSQASMLSDAWPQLTAKFQSLLEQAVTWASGCFNISERKINVWLMNEKAELISNSRSLIGTTLTRVGGVLSSTFLTPVDIFMFLLYQSHLIQFVHKLFDGDNDTKISEILSETRRIIQSYLVGLFIEFTIVATLNSIGLLLLGIDYAILLGITGAVLNVIPYIGGIIGIALFVIIALVTKAPVYILYVTALYSAIQFFDNHYIIPKIIGSKVKLNALISIIAVILGAALWGISGMFLSIPLVAILKLILDRVEPLKPYGFLLGDTSLESGKMKFKFTIKGFICSLTSKT